MPTPEVPFAYGRGWKFDYMARRFVRRGTESAQVSGHDAVSVCANRSAHYHSRNRVKTFVLKRLMRSPGDLAG